MEGMSSRKVRHLLSNITLGTDTFLEVGTWKGSTFFSAVYDKRNLEAVSIDNWSEFNGPKVDFQSNLWAYRDKLPETLNIIESDFRNVDLPLDRYDCMFYDGNHTEESQRDAVTKFTPFMQKEFIYIVDDYEWDCVRIGTEKGIEENRLEVLWSQTLPSTCINDANNYWNGVLVSVLRKPNEKSQRRQMVDSTGHES